MPCSGRCILQVEVDKCLDSGGLSDLDLRSMMRSGINNFGRMYTPWYVLCKALLVLQENMISCRRILGVKINAAVLPHKDPPTTRHRPKTSCMEAMFRNCVESGCHQSLKAWHVIRVEICAGDYQFSLQDQSRLEPS